MNIWRLKTHHIDPSQGLAWIRNTGYIAVGWGKIGDLRLLDPQSPREIGARIPDGYAGAINSANGSKSLWNLFAEMEAGDLVILSGSKSRELVVEVLGDYEYAQDAPTFNGVGTAGEYQHQRKIRVTNLSPDEIWHKAGARAAVGQNVRQTIIRCAGELPATQSRLDTLRTAVFGMRRESIFDRTDHPEAQAGPVWILDRAEPIPSHQEAPEPQGRRFMLPLAGAAHLARAFASECTPKVHSTSLSSNFIPERPR